MTDGMITILSKYIYLNDSDFLLIDNINISFLRISLHAH